MISRIITTCVLAYSVYYLDLLESAHAFSTPRPLPLHQYKTSSPRNNNFSDRQYLLPAQKTIQRSKQSIIVLSAKDGDGGEDKFSFFQRIESVKTAALGAISGGLLSTPIIALHDLPLYGAPSWEFDTDMGSLQSALFAIVYRYCIREEDENDMLNMGVVGAFVAVRTLSRVRVPSYCTAAPLDCGDPLGYFDWDMIGQLVWNGAESVALFGGAALAMEIAYKKKWISKFPN